ncbi:hypothetical protein [Domibacillus aminovorans]|uniref:Uncharacterized protein n=1 Tax=Domibacillus aminovorans TaxID=29332 RepID=A0A177L3H9_9BACI|nr:hypothetical protein [Domibacillus aminovorans]OAH59877.1 hypothetical protein AWH49_18130 [Domibacillus aminovorans]
MDKDTHDQKRFLEKQLQWSKEQARILDEIDVHLHEMKEIAEYAVKHELTLDEIEKLNGQLNELKDVIHSLEQQLQPVIH